VPGEKIVEGAWARQYGVAQLSIREALNILMAEGFVTKGHGRSARVLKSGMPTSFTSTRSAAHLKAWRRELSPNVACH
jgi:DNA-binding FadR family transcriptional regulator